MHHPESDDWAWQANVVPHRSVKELWIGIGAGEFRFMQERPRMGGGCFSRTV